MAGRVAPRAGDGGDPTWRAAATSSWRSTSPGWTRSRRSRSSRASTGRFREVVLLDDGRRRSSGSTGGPAMSTIRGSAATIASSGCAAGPSCWGPCTTTWWRSCAGAREWWWRGWRGRCRRPTSCWRRSCAGQSRDPVRRGDAVGRGLRRRVPVVGAQPGRRRSGGRRGRRRFPRPGAGRSSTGMPARTAASPPCTSPAARGSAPLATRGLPGVRGVRAVPRR